jgi:alcohol dehydrogenase class IV
MVAQLRFEFATAARIVFGEGSVREAAGEARRMGSRALVVTGRSASRAAWLVAELAAVPFAVEGEPTVDEARAGAQLARERGCDVVVAMGGGSAIDGGKAIAALAANSGEPLDYLEVVGRGQGLAHPSLPLIAVPTTAGTGSEVTRNAVLGSPAHGVKASLRSPLMLPQLAVVDPELTYGLPPAITASTGLDALTQLIEPYVSVRANPITDALCLDGIGRAAGALRRVFADGGDREARREMSLASLYGGLALANAGLGVVHGFAAPVGGMWTAPHGAVCAALLPHGVAVNIRALRLRAPGSEAIRRYETVARMLTGRSYAHAEEAVDWLRRLCSDLRIPPLGAYGVRPDDVPALVEKAAQASSTKGNPIALTVEELSEIATAAV